MILKGLLDWIKLTLSGAVLLLFCLFTQGCSEMVNKETLQVSQPLKSPVEMSAEQVKPGLSVIYFHNKFRHIREMPKSTQSIAKYGHPGQPILKIDHRFGRGEVFSSGRSERVGMIMTGFFHFAKPGVYQFQANSNDGFQLFVNGNLIVNDPTVHADHFSDPGKIEVIKGGWYPVELKYFQRKGTATLELYWQPPGAENFVIIPAEIYAHLGR